MTQVDFYVLPDAHPKGREMIACRLAEKAFTAGHKIYMHAGSLQQEQILDELLWTFRGESFVPHCRIGHETDPLPAILIGHADEPPAPHELLINLDAQVPAFFSRYERVLELVDNDAERRHLGRDRFRFYKDRGYPLNTHKL